MVKDFYILGEILNSTAERMSEEDFQKEKNTDEYKYVNGDSKFKEEMKDLFARRRVDRMKREKILEALYGNAEALGWIKDMENYRALRIEQAWISIAIGDGQRDAATRALYEDLDRRRRTLHNKALAGFCKLVEETAPFSNRANAPQNDNRYFEPREESRGDFYTGPLMIPYDEPNGYGNHNVRDAMTTGMFQFLKFIEETPRTDWDMLRGHVLAKVRASSRRNIPPDDKLPDIGELQDEIRRTPRRYGMSESPDKDEFSTELFDSRDSKYGRDSR